MIQDRSRKRRPVALEAPALVRPLEPLPGLKLALLAHPYPHTGLDSPSLRPEDRPA
jgi:hypothetical protein